MIELKKRGLTREIEVPKDIFYEGENVGLRRLDLLVNGLVIVELKAIFELENLYFNQVTNYLKVFKIEVGLLINFGSKSLQYKRFANY